MLRRLLASLFCLLTFASTLQMVLEAGGDLPVVMYLALGSLPLAAVMLHVRRLETQIFVRAVLWSMLVAGTLMSFAGSFHASNFYWMAVGMTAGPGLALLSLGVMGLDAPSAKGAFVPVAFRGVLLAVIVMALADTCSLLFWGGVLVESTGRSTRAVMTFMLVSGSIMSIAVYGLYRMRLWGFALNVLANLGIAAGAWFVPNLPDVLAACLTATAIGQLVVGLPLSFGLLKGDAKKQQMNASATQWISNAVIVGLVIATEIARQMNGA